MKLTPQQTQIINLLSDGEYHCPTAELFMKDDRKRISELRKMGYEFDSPPCDKKCGINHSSRVVMRALVKTPEVDSPTLKIRDSALVNSGFTAKRDVSAVRAPLLNFPSYNFKH